MEKDNTKKEIKNNKKLKIIIIAILAVIIVSLIIFLIIKAVNVKKVGNTVGNIRNFGYVAEDDKYIYFMSPDDKGELKALKRIDKKLEKEPEQLIAGDWDLMAINVYKDYIYFVTLSVTANEKDPVNNQIHKIKIDGSEHNVINNNEFHNSCYEIYVIKDKIYYIGADQGIYTMNLDGTSKTKIGNTSTGFVGIDDKYILYNDYKDKEKEEIATYIMNLDGTNSKILTGDYMYAPTVIENHVYYVDEEGHIFRMELGQTNFEMLSSITSYCVNVTEDGIYSLKFIDKELTRQGIFKMNLDGTGEKLVKELESTSTFLAVLEDWIVYMDETSSKGIIGMVSKDGKKYQELYSLDFNKFLENVDENEVLEEYINSITASNEIVVE